MSWERKVACVVLGVVLGLIMLMAAKGDEESGGGEGEGGGSLTPATAPGVVAVPYQEGP